MTKELLCPRCSLKTDYSQYGGERGESGPFLYCDECGYDEEAKIRLPQHSDLKLPVEKNWWDAIEPDVQALARVLAAQHSLWDIGTMTVRGDAFQQPVPGGVVYMISTGFDPSPLWTRWIDTARVAISCIEDRAVQSIVPTEPVSGTFTENDPNKNWRKEVGLDGE